MAAAGPRGGADDDEDGDGDGMASAREARKGRKRARREVPVDFLTTPISSVNDPFKHNFADIEASYMLMRKKYDVGRTEGLLAAKNSQRAVQDFCGFLSSVTTCSRFDVVSQLPESHMQNCGNIVSSIEFDNLGENFATAGVSKHIKVYNFDTFCQDMHFPVLDISTRSKLSSVDWNHFVNSHLASCDYDGVVNVWDMSTGQSIMELEAHEKRAWSVCYSARQPMMLVSGSDDGKVYLWDTTSESKPCTTIDMSANVCSVKFNPEVSHQLAIASADHNIYVYDIRRPYTPLWTCVGHAKAVSYVTYCNWQHLASASTDSSLRIWDVNTGKIVRKLQGHLNEKNFVGLSSNGGLISCGSESNEVFVYHESLSSPLLKHKFGHKGNPQSYLARQFISSVCWKPRSKTLVAANSQGHIQVLEMRR